MSNNFQRFHPLRISAEVRDQNADVSLSVRDLILPFFVVEGEGVDEPIATLKGVSHLSIDRLVQAVQNALDGGIDKVLLFGVPDEAEKHPQARAAVRQDALVSRAVSTLKAKFPKLTVMTDVCVCAYTDHGHCGLVRGQTLDNDLTLPVLAEMALSHARAGADYVAPSAMMDGQVLAIRERLDAQGFRSTKIMGYSAKYASKLYGPFRDAAGSAPGWGDRKTYQMDFRTRLQGVDEAAADLEEGADVLMVKPATFYLDMLTRVKTRFPQVPLAAYHTSGEYMLVVHGASHGLFSEQEGLLENLYAIKRAGADWIITYAALDAAGWLA
jgi:porphobilinogen synthase